MEQKFVQRNPLEQIYDFYIIEKYVRIKKNVFFYIIINKEVMDGL